MQSKGGRRRSLELGNGGATREALARRASGREGRRGGEPSGSRWAGPTGSEGGAAPQRLGIDGLDVSIAEAWSAEEPLSPG